MAAGIEKFANRIIQGDCLEVMRTMPDGCVDLVFGSPPYEAARTYGIDFKLRGQDWVDWMVERIVEMVRVCKGLVAMVVEGQTRQFRWSASPALLMADLHRRGIHLRKPPAFHRVGIPGSGGPDFLRNDYEFIVCCTGGGKLPWSDNTAMGHPPKWAPGGAMSNRTADDKRKNARGFSGQSRDQWGGVNGTVCRSANGKRQSGKRPSHFVHTKANGETVLRENRKVINGDKDGMHAQPQSYSVPVLANPGNVIKCIVGGGVMGSKLAAENEAPFPNVLAEFFVRSFCPPDGIAMDPFSGSGTTVSAAKQNGRQFIGIDIRDSQVDLSVRRLAEPPPTVKKLAKKRKAKPAVGQKELFA